MMKFKCALLILLIFISTALYAEELRVVRHLYYMEVRDTVSAVSNIRGFAEKNSGYVKYYSDKKIVLRLKEQSVNALRAFLAGTGFIIDEQVYRRSVTGKVVDLRTRLRVKEKLHRDLLELFNSSSFHQALDVEKEISRQILEIEKLKGELAYYMDQASLTLITVMFTGPVSPGGQSAASTRWGWIRKLGIPGLIQSWEVP